MFNRAEPKKNLSRNGGSEGMETSEEEESSEEEKEEEEEDEEDEWEWEETYTYTEWFPPDFWKVNAYDHDGEDNVDK